MHTHWDRRGDGDRLLVLIHGVGLDHTMWDAYVEPLVAAGYSILRYDLPGHGETPPVGGQLTLAHCTAQLLQLLRQQDVAGAALVGFSLGALVARAFTVSCPQQVSHLVLLNSVYRRSEAQRDAVRARCAHAREHGLASLVEAAFERWFTPAFARRQPQVLARVRARLEANTAQGFLPAYRLFADAPDESPAQLAAIRAPALVITGADDPGSTPEMSRRLAAAISGAQLDIVAGARHMLPVERADWVACRVREFVSCTTEKT